MSVINIKDTEIPLDVMADARMVSDCAAAGKPIPADVAKRIHERAEQIKREIFQKFGLLDIGVPAIRELRGDLPEP